MADSSDARTGSNTSPATTNAGVAAGSEEEGSDCDLVDIDGNNNTVAVNLTSNTTTDDGVAIRFRCEANTTTPINHDLIDVTGTNNTVTVLLRVEDGGIVVGGDEPPANSSGRIALQCKGGTDTDCDAVDIDGYSNSVTLIVQRDGGRTVHEFGSNASTGQQTP